MIIQALGLVGAFLVLVAYWMVSSGRFAPTAYAYIVVNAAGSMMLLTVAYYTMQLGYIVLNIAWLFITWYALKRRLDGNG